MSFVAEDTVVAEARFEVWPADDLVVEDRDTVVSRRRAVDVAPTPASRLGRLARCEGRRATFSAGAAEGADAKGDGLPSSKCRGACRAWVACVRAGRCFAAAAAARSSTDTLSSVAAST